MRLVFGPDDDQEFSAARDALLERFERWLADSPSAAAVDVAELTGEAGLALDWKWSYGDGDLGLWRILDVVEFLLEWCPRKLSVAPADCVSIPMALAAFVAFLGDQGLLAAGSAPAAALGDATVQMTDEFLAAMGDPSNFGMAKSLLGAADADGVDLADPDRMQEWVEEFNARPKDERRGLIPDRALAGPRRPVLPPVVLPDESEVAVSMAAAPVLAMFADFAAFVGTGRKLTQTANLTLADARELVGLLGTGDVMDEQIGDRTFKTKSAAELPRLRQFFAWAKKAGVVRVANGRIIATKRGLALPRDPAALFDRSVDALLAIGAVSSQRDPDRLMALPAVDVTLDDLVALLLAGPYGAMGPITLEVMSEVATTGVLEMFEFPALSDDHVARYVAIAVVDLMDALELAGMVRRVDVPPASDPNAGPGRRRIGGSVELTPAGVVTARRLLVEKGHEAPTAGRLVESTATVLLQSLDLEDFPMLCAEIEAWRRRREPAQVAGELAAAVRELRDPALQNIGLAAMAELDPAVSTPEVRRLAEEPATRGFAMCWLVDEGLEDPKAQFDPDDVSWFADVLAHRLMTGGESGLVDTLALAGDDQAQARAVKGLWRSPSTTTEIVLVAIREMHPTKAIAKAARKAELRRRTWLASQLPPDGVLDR